MSEEKLFDALDDAMSRMTDEQNLDLLKLWTDYIKSVNDLVSVVVEANE